MRAQKMAEPPATPSDEWRCHRNDGKLWRCKNQKRADHSLCDDHYNQQLAKTQRGVLRSGSVRVRSRGAFVASRRRRTAEPTAEEATRPAKRRRKGRAAATAMDDPTTQVMVYERRGKATAASGRKKRGKPSDEPPAKKVSGRGRKSISRPMVMRKKRSSLINPPSSEESLPLAKMFKGGKSQSNSTSASSFSSIQEKDKEARRAITRHAIDTEDDPYVEMTEEGNSEDVDPKNPLSASPSPSRSPSPSGPSHASRPSDAHTSSASPASTPEGGATSSTSGKRKIMYVDKSSEAIIHSLNEIVAAIKELKSAMDSIPPVDRILSELRTIENLEEDEILTYMDFLVCNKAKATVFFHMPAHLRREWLQKKAGI